MGELELDQQAAGPKHMQFVGLFAILSGHHSCVYGAKKAFASDSILEDIDRIV